MTDYIRKMDWDGDILHIQDSIQNIVDNMDKMTEDVVCQHFNCDLSDLRDYYRDKVEWRRKQEQAIPKWIPVTEDNPHDDDFYYITILDEHGDPPRVYTDVGWYCEEAKRWVKEGVMRNDVIAWFPHVEPYNPPKDERGECE